MKTRKWSPLAGSAIGSGQPSADTHYTHIFRIAGGSQNEIPLPPGASTFRSAVLSPDGSTIAGAVVYPSGDVHAFTWKSGTPGDLGLIGTDANAGIKGSDVTGVSSKGQVVGWGQSSARLAGFIFSNGKLVFLNSLGGAASIAMGISADGGTIVGWADTPPPPRLRPVKWNTLTGQITDIGGVRLLLDGAEGGGISADGSTIVGSGNSTANRQVALYWKGNSTEPTMLPILPSESEAVAQAASADGTFIVGESGSYPVRWTHGVISALGGLPSDWFSADAIGVSADGSLVIGRGLSSRNGFLSHAFVWKDGRFADLNSRFLYAEGRSTGLSSDGTVIVGLGRKT